MIKLSKTKTSLIVALICIFCTATLLTAFLFFPKDTVNAFTSVDDSNAVVVPELWDSSTKTFNTTNLKTLLSFISNDGTINGVNTTQQTATDIRGYTYGGKTNEQAVVVTLGGYQWQVVYLTRTGDTAGDRIATLLMVNNDGTARYGSSSYHGDNDFTSGYPTSMYGTSHIRAVTLNNGGPYVNIANNNSNPTSVTQATQSSSHKYALYTVDSLGLTDYLVQPKNVWYQTQAQLTGSANPARYTLNNESLVTNLSGYYNNYTYQTKTYYTQWGNDHLWLPSISEAGTSDTYDGIWELSTTERSASTNWWSRSGNFSNSINAYYLNSSGSSSSSNYVHFSYGVRAALHLNLDIAVNSVINYIIVESSNTNQGTVSGGGEFDADYSGTTTITATPMKGYLFDYWQDSSGNKIYQNPYTFPVTQNETYIAYFKPNPVIVTSNNNGSEISSSESEITSTYYIYTITFTQNNYVSGITVNSGVMQDITATSGTLATDDSCILIMYGTNATGSRLYLNVIGAVSEVVINLHFVDIAQNYTPASGGVSLEGVALQVSGGSGSTFEAVGEARITGYSQAENITYVHVSAVPSSGYYFVGWQTNDDTDLTDYGSSADIPYNLIEGKILTAVFAPNPSNSQTNSTTDNTGTEIG